MKFGVNLDGTPTLFLTMNDGDNEQVDILKTLDMNANFIQFSEISLPSNPASDTGLIYLRDVAGTTTPFFLDSSGTETSMIGAATNLLPLNNTWTGSNTFDGSPFIINGAITTLASTTSTSITSPLIVLGDGATDNISFGGQVDTNIVMEEISEPGNAQSRGLLFWLRGPDF